MTYGGLGEMFEVDFTDICRSPIFSVLIFQKNIPYYFNAGRVTVREDFLLSCREQAEICNASWEPYKRIFNPKLVEDLQWWVNSGLLWPWVWLFIFTIMIEVGEEVLGWWIDGFLGTFLGEELTSHRGQRILPRTANSGWCWCPAQISTLCI